MRAAPGTVEVAASPAGGFRRLLVAHGTGTTAQVVLTLAMGVHVLDRTGSGIWVSVTVALAFAPYAVLSSLAGVVADRCSRSAVLGWGCRVRAGITGLLAGAIHLGWPVPMLVGLTAVVAVAATPSYPALLAAAPQCLAARRLPAANTLATGVENATWIAAPGLYGVSVLAGVPSIGAVAGCAAAFAVAAGTASGVRLAAPARSQPSPWWRELIAVLSLLARCAAVRRPMALAILDNLLYGYLVVALVLLVDSAPATGSTRLGALNAALALGALGALAVVTRLVSGALLPTLPWAMLVLFAACLAALGVLGTGALGLAVVALAGATTLVAEVASVTLLQREASQDTLGRVFGVYDQLNVGAIALGSLVAGPAAAWLGPRTALVVVPLVCLAPTLGLRRGAG